MSVKVDLGPELKSGCQRLSAWSFLTPPPTGCDTPYVLLSALWARFLLPISAGGDAKSKTLKERRRPLFLMGIRVVSGQRPCI